MADGGGDMYHDPGTAPAAAPPPPANTDNWMMPESNNNFNGIMMEPVTIVVQLQGEMGNQVGKIGHGLCLKYLIRDRLGLDAKIKLRAKLKQQDKWKHAMEWTKQAFPNTRPLNFTEANTNEFLDLHNKQGTWLNSERLMFKNRKLLQQQKDCITESCLEEFLQLLNLTYWARMRMNQKTLFKEQSSTNISIPHVYSDSFCEGYCLDHYAKDIRDFFTLDREAICKQVPDSDETVLHLRNFLVEFRHNFGMKIGFEELSPAKMASEIFKNHQAGDKVAIISRFEKDIVTYRQALEAKGLQVRYIQNQTGNEDFCFLQSAKKEIIGIARSTFAYWAGVLGDAKLVRLYSVDSRYTRRRWGNDHLLHKYYNFTNDEHLQKKFSFELYQA